MAGKKPVKKAANGLTSSVKAYVEDKKPKTFADNQAFINKLNTQAALNRSGIKPPATTVKGVIGKGPQMVGARASGVKPSMRAKPSTNRPVYQGGKLRAMSKGGSTKKK